MIKYIYISNGVYHVLESKISFLSTKKKKKRKIETRFNKVFFREKKIRNAIF